MAPPRWLPWTLAAAVAAIVLARALAVFTFPSDSQGTHAIRSAIGAALGDPKPAIPTTASFGALPTVGELRSLPGALPMTERCWVCWPTAESIGLEAREWARAAAAANPAALRRWLTAPSYTSRRTHLDTTYVISRRLSLGEGCPVISTLRAAFYQDTTGLHLASLASNCPRTAGAADAR